MIESSVTEMFAELTRFRCDESEQERRERKKKLRLLIKQEESRQKKEDREFESIERGSRSPFRGLQGNRVILDLEILAGFADPNEIENEERIGRHCDQEFMKSHPERVAESDRVIEESRVSDFRESLDPEEQGEQDKEQKAKIGNIPLQDLPADQIQVSQNVAILVPKVPDRHASVA